VEAILVNYAIILAGGVGSRFWPLSRQSRPKQFLNICSENPLLVDTVRRISAIVKKENVYIASGSMHKTTLKKCLGGLGIPLGNIFLEPQGKNTLAPIAVLTNKIYSQDKDALIGVLPSDHFIKETPKFIATLTRAFNIARYAYIVTMGIKPLRAETGYGYIKAEEKIHIPAVGLCYKAQRFIEKPDIAKAKAFIKDGRYYWNSGMFIFKAAVMLGEIKKFMPQAYRLIKSIKNEKDSAKIWPKLPSISIDYAIMEKTVKAVVLPADYSWTDLGSWQALEEIMPQDKRRNVLKGNCFDIGSSNIFVWSAKSLTATVGLKDIIIVDTDDALLVCHKDKAQDVKKLVQSFKNSRLRKYL